MIPRTAGRTPETIPNPIPLLLTPCPATGDIDDAMGCDILVCCIWFVGDGGEGPPKDEMKQIKRADLASLEGIWEMKVDTQKGG